MSIGDNTNIQDGAFVGAISEFSPPCKIGKNVSIGHGAVLKGCTIEDNVLVGINAVISEHVTVSCSSRCPTAWLHVDTAFTVAPILACTSEWARWVRGRLPVCLDGSYYGALGADHIVLQHHVGRGASGLRGG